MTRILTATLLVAACVLPTPAHASTMVPGIHGTVFLDNDMSGGFSPGEELSGVTVQLFEDDGNGVLDGSDAQVGSAMMTDVNGTYSFGNLDPDRSYFVVRPAQTVDSLSLAQDMSGLLTPSTPNLVIDSFDNNQVVRADPFTPISTSTLTDPAANVLGGERDLYVRLVSGIGEVELRSNAFGVAVIQYDNTAGVVGNGIISYDGEDMSASPVPSLGLGDIDLTQGGTNTGVFFKLGIDATGEGELIKFRIFDDSPSEYSEGLVEFPVTDGTAVGSAYLDFSELVGPVSPTNVNAIQMWVGEDSPSIDAQIDIVGALGPVQQDFLVEIPEPSSLMLALVGCCGLLLRRPRR